MSVVVENVATPPETGPVPMEVAPSKKVTVPVAADGVTVAVNVTDWPEVDGFKLEVKAVVLQALLTV